MVSPVYPTLWQGHMSLKLLLACLSGRAIQPAPRRELGPMLLEGMTRLTQNTVTEGNVPSHPCPSPPGPDLSLSCGIVCVSGFRMQSGTCVKVRILHALCPGIVVFSDYLKSIDTGCQPWRHWECNHWLTRLLL